MSGFGWYWLAVVGIVAVFALGMLAGSQLRWIAGPLVVCAGVASFAFLLALLDATYHAGRRSR